MSDPQTSTQSGMDIDNGDLGGPPRIDGRTREGRAQRVASQPDNGDPDNGYAPQRRGTRNGARQTRGASRDGTRSSIEVRGRNGEVLSRRRIAGGDTFALPDELKEAGWDYQWIPVSVTGNTEVVADQNLQMLENGWRPVESNRFPGRYMPAGHSGHIVRGGQGLYERPLELSLAAKREDQQVALAQMRDRDASLMGRKANLAGSLPNGMAMDPSRYRGTGGRLAMSIDPALDIHPPSHELAQPGDE